MTVMINPRGRFHELTLTVGGHDFTKQIEGDIVIEWEYIELGGVWRRSLKCTLHDSPNKPSNQTLSWEDNVALWKEGAAVTVTLGADTIFQGRILSITAPPEEADYIGDWKISFEAGDVLYYANYQNRDMGNYADTSLDANKTLGDVVDKILDYAGFALANKTSLTASCNFNFASRDQEGLVSGMAGAVAYQQGQWVLAAENTTITAYQENFTGNADATYGINETLEFSPIPDGEPLVEQLELLSNAQSYVLQGSANYSYDNRINGEGFVGEGQWTVAGEFAELLSEYRKRSALDPESNSSVIYELHTKTVRVYNANGFLTTIRQFAWGDAPMWFRRNIKEMPNQALSYSISNPSTNNPSASNVWFLDTTTYTINSNNVITKITSTKNEYLCEQLNPRADRNISAGVTNIGTTTDPWEIYTTVTDKQETVIQQLGPKWYTKPSFYNWQRNLWEPQEVTVSDDPTEPEVKPKLIGNDIYSLETVELSSTATLSTADPNPNFTDKKRVTVEYAGNQTRLNALCNHYVTIVKGRRRMWKITVPYSGTLYNLIKLPCRKIAWSPDAHNRQLKYMVVGAAIRLSERLSVVDLELLHIGSV